MYKIFEFCVMFIYFHIFAHYINNISATVGLGGLNNENTSIPQNGFEPFKSLNDIHMNLCHFIASKSKIVGDKIDYNYLNYEHLKAAQIGIVHFAEKMLCKNRPTNDFLKRNERIKFLSKFNSHLSPGVIICKYISILKNFRIAYQLLYYSKIRSMNPYFLHKFVSSLSGILNEMHLCEYIRFIDDSAAHDLYILKGQNYRPNSPKSLIEQAFKGVVHNNHIIFYKLLIIVYQWQILLPIERNIFSKYNPILIGHRNIKDSKFLTFNIDQTLAIILNDLLIFAFNQAGLEIIDKKGCNLLIFYSKKDNLVKGVEIQDLIFQEYKGLSKMPENPNMRHLFIDISTVIDIFYTDLSYISKKVLTIHIIHLILLSSVKIKYNAMCNIWNCFAIKHMQYFAKPVNDFMLLVLSTEISTFPEKYKKHYTEICQKTDLNIIWDLYVIYITDVMYNCFLSLTRDFYLIDELIKDPNYNILYIFENQVILLNRLLPATIYDSRNKKFLSIATGVLNGLSDKALNICKQYTEKEYIINVKNIIAYVYIILTRSLLFFDLEMILRNIENFLCNQELNLLPQFDFNDILKSITNISDFLKYIKNKKHEISDYNKERIGNIVFKFLFILLDLNITLKEPIMGNTCGKNLKLILDYLAARKFNELIFTQLASKSLAPASTAKNDGNKYFCLIQYLYYCNVIPNKRKLCHIHMIFIDVLQIRLRLLKDFHCLTDSILYDLLIKTDSRPEINSNQEERSEIYPNREERLDFKTGHETSSENLLGEDIISMFTISPKNDFELILITFLDILFTLRRLEYVNKIELSRLRKLVEEMNTVNYKMDHFDISILIFNEYGCILFSHVIIAVQNFCLSSDSSQASVNDFKNTLNMSLFSIINKLHAGLTNNQKYSAINFYIFMGLSQVKPINFKYFENLESFRELKNRLKEFETEYFKFSIKRESIEIAWINILFPQLLSFMNISEKCEDELIIFSLIEDIKLNCSNNSLDRFILTFKDPNDINYNHPKYMNDGLQGFFHLFKNQISDFPEICEVVLQILIERFRITVNYNSNCLQYCYLLFFIILEINLNHKSVSFNLDELFAKHIENCNLKNSYKSLCDIIKLYIKTLINHRSLYEGEFLLSLTAAHDRSREMQWDHPILREY